MVNFHPPTLRIEGGGVGGGQVAGVERIGQVAVERPTGLDLDQAYALSGSALTDPHHPILEVCTQT